MMKTALCIGLSLVGSALAQDPAEGWMAYAVGQVPASVDRITRLEMKWKVSNNPSSSSAFFSPWFGMDPLDNLNLIQPVNPWSGGEWSMYTEYFQWKPTHNSNSPQKGVEAGQTLHGFLIYDTATDSYNLTQTVVETGATSYQNVRCQWGKKYKLPYVVYEKTFPAEFVAVVEKARYNDSKWKNAGALANGVKRYNNLLSASDAMFGNLQTLVAASCETDESGKRIAGCARLLAVISAVALSFFVSLLFIFVVGWSSLVKYYELLLQMNACDTNQCITDVTANMVLL